MKSFNFLFYTAFVVLFFIANIDLICQRTIRENKEVSEPLIKQLRKFYIKEIERQEQGSYIEKIPIGSGIFLDPQMTSYAVALPILSKLNKFDTMFNTWGKFENRPIDTNTLFGSYNVMRWNVVRVNSNVNSLITMVTQDNKILKESLENSKIGKPSNFTDKNDETLWAAIGQTRTKVSNISTTIITSIDSFKEDANKKLESIDVRLKNLEPKAIKSDTVNFKILLGVSDKSVANLSAAYYVDNQYALAMGVYQVDINTLVSIGIEKRINDMFFTAAPIYHKKHSIDKFSMVFSCGFYTSGLTAAALYSPLVGMGAQIGCGF